MPQPDLPLTASFYHPSEDAPSIPVEAVAEIIRDKYPDATIDWERGRQKMTADVQRLIDMGCPEIIYRGQKSLIDKTIFVSIPVTGAPCVLSGYTFGFSWYDGCISLECDPFDINGLMTGAQRFATDMGLDCYLCAGDLEDVNLEIILRTMTPQQIVADRFPLDHLAPPSFTPLPDWKERLTTGCREWLMQHPTKRITDQQIANFGSGDRLAKCLIERIESIGPVLAVSRVYFGDGKWHSILVFEYTDWTGLLNLPRVAAPLLG